MKLRILMTFLLIFSLFLLVGCNKESSQGPQGEKGETGLQGPQGSQGEQGLQGETGNGITSITLTDTEGLVDTYTITYTDGTITTFTVTNGKDGAQGGQGIQGIQGVPGKDGHTPVITIVDGYWYIDGVNTNVLAEGLKGETGNSISSIKLTKTEGLIDTYTITYTDGTITTFTVTNGKDGEDGAQGEQGIQGIQGVPGQDGHTPVITIEGGYWYIDGVNTNVLAEGIKGETGNGISSITLTKTEGLIDTYTITFTDGSTTTFTVTNGKDGEDGAQGEQGIQGIQGVPGKDGHTPVITIEGGYWYIDGTTTGIRAEGLKGETGNGISSILLTKTEGLIDTYTITYTDGSTTTFTVTNGKDGEDGAQGEQGIQGIQGVPGKDGHTPVITIEGGYWYIDGMTTGIRAEGLKGETGNGISLIKLTKTEGLIDTYTITFTDGSITTFTVTNGKDGAQGIQGIQGVPGKDGHTPVITIVDGYWYIDGVTTGIRAEGLKGDTGNGISSITLTSSKDNVDTYTITFTNGTITTFTVTNGKDGEDGAQGEQGNDGKSAYEIYVEAHPEYTKSEEEWIIDLINGQLITQTYTITFNSNGGTEVAPQKVLHGYKASKPIIPERLGYTFDGWYVDDEKWVFTGYPVTEDLVLTAKWIQNEYEIILNNNESEEIIKIHYDEKYELPTPTKEGYSFIGWYDENDNLYASGTYTYTHDMYLTAKYVFMYEVTFDSDGGNIIESCKAEKNILTELPTPIKDGWVFYGWYSDNNQLITTPFEYFSDITLTAKWVSIAEEFNYVSLDDTTAQIVSYNGTKTDVVIPETIGRYTIVDVSKEIFANNKNITSIVLPSTLTSVQEGVLEGCNSIEWIQISDNTPTTLLNLFNVSSDSQLPLSLSTIKYNDGFYYNNSNFFTGVTSSYTFVLPSSLTSIPDGAFRYCANISNLIIPSSVMSIGFDSFADCANLTSVVIPDSVINIGVYAFSNCRKLESVVIPEGITTIGASTFSNCSNLTSVELPTTLTKIEGYAFRGCSSLKNIVIPEGVTIIEGRAFEECKFNVLVIPRSITKIEDSAFYYTVVEKIYYNGNIEDWLHISFASTSSNPMTYSSNASLYFLDENGDVKYNGKSYSLLIDVVIPNTITEVNSSAFYSNNNLQSVVIHEGVTSIGVNTFACCKNLKNVVLPNTLTSIGGRAFAGCSSLESIIIPEGVKIIGDYAFDTCTSLTNIILSEGLTHIGNGSFCDCSSLINIEIPEGVTSIGGAVFKGCSSLTSIEIPEGVTSIGSGAFEYCSNLEFVKLPSTLVNIESETFRGCYKLNSIEIPEGVTSIGASAFIGCSKLTSIKLPISLTSIGNSAFYLCSSLDVFYNGSLEQWNLISIGQGNENYLQNVTYGHTEHYYEEEVIAPTCDEQGYTKYSCVECGYYYIENYTDILQHQVVTDEAVDPTCTSTGLTEGSHCGLCQKVFYEQEIVPALEHNYIDSICQNCGKNENTDYYTEGLQFTDKGNSYEVTSYNGEDTNVIIPSMYNGKPVTTIGTSAFSGSSIESVNLPNTLVNIGWYAFKGCANLITVEITEGVETIGKEAFLGCINLKNIELPESITSIEEYAFGDCRSLENIVLPSGLTTISNHIFIDCISLSYIVIPNGVTHIKNSAFYRCEGLNTIIIPKSVTQIDEYALWSSQETKILYEGTYWEWEELSENNYNFLLKEPLIYYYSQNEPTISGNYWHYDTDGVTPIEW